jgi:WD repeat-containing protein 61
VGETLNGNQEAGEEEDSSASVGQGPLAGESTVVETGKGKFGMAIEYVSFLTPRISHNIIHDHTDRQQSPDGRQIAMSTETGHVVIIDTESQAVVADYSSHAMPARTIAWSEDSHVSWL